ncbi:MAG: hypothetical protein WDZ79_01000, partial [Candidatus Paceibacterota bacterium]
MAPNASPEGQPVKIDFGKRIDVERAQNERIAGGLQDQIFDIEEATIEAIHKAIDRARDLDQREKEEWHAFLDEKFKENIATDEPVELYLDPRPKGLFLIFKAAVEAERAKKKGGDTLDETENKDTKMLEGVHTIPAGEEWTTSNVKNAEITIEPGASLTVLAGVENSTFHVQKRSQIKLPEGEHKNVIIDTSRPSKRGGPRGIQEKPWALDAFYEFGRMKAPTPQKLKDTIYEVGPVAREYAPTIETEEDQVTPDDIWQAVKEDLRNEQVRRAPPLGELRERVREVIEKNAAKTVADFEIETEDVDELSADLPEGKEKGETEKPEPKTREPEEERPSVDERSSKKQIHSRIWPNRHSEDEWEMKQDEWEQRGEAVDRPTEDKPVEGQEAPVTEGSQQRPEDTKPSEKETIKEGDAVRVYDVQSADRPMFDGRSVKVTGVAEEGAFVYVLDRGDYELKLDRELYRLERVERKPVT